MVAACCQLVDATYFEQATRRNRSGTSRIRPPSLPSERNSCCSASSVPLNVSMEYTGKREVGQSFSMFVMLVPPKVMREPTIDPEPAIMTSAWVPPKPSASPHGGGLESNGEPDQNFDEMVPRSD